MWVSMPVADVANMPPLAVEIIPAIIEIIAPAWMAPRFGEELPISTRINGRFQ